MDFSIIIPAKNEQVNIDDCLDSINSMDFDKDRYELLLIDNGSSDRTVEVAKGKGAKVYVQPELTIAGLRNFGAAKARGTILAFLDADCSVAVNWLQEASRYLDDRIIVCFGSPPIVPADATWVQKAWFLIRRKKMTVQKVDWLESMNLFVRRETFEACGGFDENLVTCEDYDLTLRLKKMGTLLNDSRIVAIHHGEASTVRHFYRKEKWRAASNFKGLLRHGLVLREIPSLVAPLGHCILLVLVILSPLLLSTGVAGIIFTLFLLWQALLLLVSYRKNQPGAVLMPVMQLYWLLNIYFTARGLAVLTGTRR